MGLSPAVNQNCGFGVKKLLVVCGMSLVCTWLLPTPTGSDGACIAVIVLINKPLSLLCVMLLNQQHYCGSSVSLDKSLNKDLGIGSCTLTAWILISA